MSGHAPANQLRLSLPSSDRVKPERDRVSGETTSGGKGFEPPAKIREPPYGPVRTVVWEGWGCEASPYPD
jgi:hypothetical protein